MEEELVCEGGELGEVEEGAASGATRVLVDWLGMEVEAGGMVGAAAVVGEEFLGDTLWLLSRFLKPKDFHRELIKSMSLVVKEPW